MGCEQRCMVCWRQAQQCNIDSKVPKQRHCTAARAPPAPQQPRPTLLSTTPRPGQRTCSNEGRTLGSRCQQSRMMSDSGGGQFGGMGGRSPFCTTPTAACSGVMSL